MTDTTDKIDYSKTLYLPQTEFPMRAGLPREGARLVQALAGDGPLQRLRDDAAGRDEIRAA